MLRFLAALQAAILIVNTCGCGSILKGDDPSTSEKRTDEISPLLMAISSNSLEWVKEEVENGADLDLGTTGGYLQEEFLIPLQYADRVCDNYYISDYLIEAGADVSFLNSEGETFLFGAACGNPEDEDWCQYLLEHGVDINHKCNKGYTALDEAVVRDYSKSKFLIEHGATVSRQTLEMAVGGPYGKGYENLDIVRLVVETCLKNQIDIDDIVPPLITAAIRGDSSSILGAVPEDIAALDDDQKRMLGYNLVAFCSRDALIHCLDNGLTGFAWDLAPSGIAAEYGNVDTLSWVMENESAFVLNWIPSAAYVLSTAVSAGQLQTAQYLLDHGVTVNFSVPQHDSTSDLTRAVSSGNIQLVELLVERGGPVCYQLLLQAYYEASSVAYRTGNSEMAKKIFSYIDFSATSRQEEERIWTSSYPSLELLQLCAEQGIARPDSSMLLDAVYWNLPDIAEFLLQLGSEVTYDSMYMAVARGYFDILKLLVSYGADVNMSREGHETYPPLMCDAAATSAHITEYLIQCGADVNARLADGTSALMLAAMRGRMPCVRLLLEAGADVSITNDEGEDALSLAKEWGDPDMIALLSAYQK